MANGENVQVDEVDESSLAWAKKLCEDNGGTFTAEKLPNGKYRITCTTPAAGNN